MNPETKGFQCSYSAKEWAELKEIREKYLDSKEDSEKDKMAKIRRLDAGVTQKATTIALCVGIIGTLLLGFGMSLIMTDLQRIFGTYTTLSFLFGMIFGLIGMVAILFAYPIYGKILVKQRKKVAPEILRLTQSLLSAWEETQK